MFQAPASNADKKAAKDARKRAKEAVKEKARKKAEAAAAEAEASKGETPAEKKTRIAREDKVKQMLFNLSQEEGNAFFTTTYKRLAVRVPHSCRAPVRLPTTLLAPQILDVIVMFTYMVYLIFVYPAREPTFAKNSTTEMLAPVRDRPCIARQPARSPLYRKTACTHSISVLLMAGASMVPFHRCDFRVACCDRKFGQLAVTLNCACRDRVQGSEVSCVASHRKGDDVHPLHRSVDQLSVHHFRHHEGQ